MNDKLDNSVQTIWQCQPVEGVKMSVDAIRLRAGKFERKVWRRNLRESIAALIVIPFFAYFFLKAGDIPFRVTWGLFMAGMIWVVVQLWRRGRPKTVPAAMGSSTAVEFFRRELERQRDLVKEVWTWYLVPLVPGYVALNVADALNVHGPGGWVRLGLLDVFLAIVFIGTWQLNVYAARCLQRSIDELNSAEEPR